MYCTVSHLFSCVRVLPAAYPTVADALADDTLGLNSLRAIVAVATAPDGTALASILSNTSFTGVILAPSDAAFDASSPDDASDGANITEADRIGAFFALTYHGELQK